MQGPYGSSSSYNSHNISHHHHTGYGPSSLSGPPPPVGMKGGPPPPGSGIPPRIGPGGVVMGGGSSLGSSGGGGSMGMSGVPGGGGSMVGRDVRDEIVDLGPAPKDTFIEQTISKPPLCSTLDELYYTHKYQQKFSILHRITEINKSASSWGLNEIPFVSNFRQVFKNFTRKKVRSIDWSRCGQFCLHVLDDGVVRIYDISRGLEHPVRVQDPIRSTGDQGGAQYDFTGACFDRIDNWAFSCVSSKGRFCFYDMREKAQKHFLHDVVLTRTHEDLVDFINIQPSPCGGEFAIQNMAEKVFILERRKEDPQGNRHSLRLANNIFHPSKQLLKSNNSQSQNSNNLSANQTKNTMSNLNCTNPYLCIQYADDVETFCPDFFSDSITTGTSSVAQTTDTTKSDPTVTTAGSSDSWECNDYCYSHSGNSILFAYHNGIVASHQRRSPQIQGPALGAQSASTVSPRNGIFCHRSGISCITADRRGEYVATSGFDGTVSIWEAGGPVGFSGIRVAHHHVGAKPVSNMSFNYNSEILTLGFGPTYAAGGERLKQDHWNLTGNTNFLGNNLGGGSSSSYGENNLPHSSSEDSRSNKAYSRDLVFLNSRTGDVFSRDELGLPGSVTCMKWHPFRNILAFAMNESQFQVQLPTVHGGVNPSGNENLNNGLAQLIKVPETYERMSDSLPRNYKEETPMVI